MPPVQQHPYARAKAANRAIPPDPAEIAHLAVLAADTIESLPPALTRSLSDLKELDAVLNTALSQVTGKLANLLDLTEDANVTPAQRLALLKEVADEAAGFKLGGEDKIRVATGTCESILHHSKQLDLITSLMTSLMPQHVLEQIPASATPSGYPHLFPSYGSATAASLYRPRTDFFPTGPAGYAGALAAAPMGITRAAQANYNQALSQVQRYQAEGPLPSTHGYGTSRHRADRAPAQSAARKRASHSLHSSFFGSKATHTAQPPVQAPRARTITQQSHIAGTMPATEPVQTLQTESPMIDAPSPVNGKKRPRIPPPPAVQTVWDVPPGAEADDGSNVGSPASGATNGRSSKRPRPTQNTSEKSNGGNSPVGERPPSLGGGATRRRQVKKASPDPRSPASGSRERLPPTNGRSRRGAASEMPDETEEPLPEDEVAEVEVPDTANVEAEIIKEDAPPGPASTGTEPGSEQVYCTCRRVSYGEMIGCDGEDCKIEWFHLACVGLSDPPKGRWICPDCSKDERNLKKRRTQ